MQLLTFGAPVALAPRRAPKGWGQLTAHSWHKAQTTTVPSRLAQATCSAITVSLPSPQGMFLSSTDTSSSSDSEQYFTPVTSTLCGRQSLRSVVTVWPFFEKLCLLQLNLETPVPVRCKCPVFPC